jgi:hypothetical protein
VLLLTAMVFVKRDMSRMQSELVADSGSRGSRL